MLERHGGQPFPLAASGLQQRRSFEADACNPQPGISPPTPRARRCCHHCPPCHPRHLGHGFRYNRQRQLLMSAELCSSKEIPEAI